jgi:hypothetical protein
MAKSNSKLTAVGALIVHVITQAADAIFANDKIKLQQIKMLGAGGRTWENIEQTIERWDGFAVWARYGFDMPLRTQTLAMFKHFPHFPRFNKSAPACTQLSQLLLLEGGLKFWDIVGDGWYMTFDATSGSSCRRVLASYLKGKYQ